MIWSIKKTKKGIANLVRLSSSFVGLQVVRAHPLFSYSAQLLDIPIDCCCTGYGFSFKPGVGNPFVDFPLEQLNADFVDTSFYRFCHAYNPLNARDVFFPGSLSHPRLKDVRIDPDFSKFRVPEFPLFWSRPYQIRRYMVKQSNFSESIDNTHILSKAEQHFHRSSVVFRSIKQEGFQIPTEGPSLSQAFICGVLLKRGPDLRFVVTSGQHRVGALVALGWTDIPVLLDNHFAPTVDRKFAAHWPIVTENLYTLEAALACFDRFFDDDGSAIAKAYGLAG